MSEKLKGIFTPTLVPLDAHGEINEPELRRFISWLIERGVHGLYPNGSTGEFTRFTLEERRRIVQITCDDWGDASTTLATAQQNASGSGQSSSNSVGVQAHLTAMDPVVRVAGAREIQRA